MLAALEEKYPDDLRVAYRHFPLSSHDKAALATQAAEAAGLQGKFWEMHDLLFEKRAEWMELTVEDFETWLATQAAELNLDVGKFNSDLKSEALVNLAKEAFDRNAMIGMPGTPFMVINGYPYSGQLDQGSLQTTIDLILLEREQFSDCPPLTVDPTKQYLATIKTEKGDIQLELFAEQSPLAVNNFIYLANQGWYEGVTFHRVLPGFVAQAGDPTGSGFGGPGYAFDNETSPDLKFDSEGILAMANAGAGSNGSQFFITYAPAPQLDGGYTIFGRVISGMDVLKSLAPRDPTTAADLPPGDQIISITIEEKSP